MNIDRAFLRALITAASFFGGAAYYLPSAASDLPVKHVDLGDARIAYVEQGQGEPVGEPDVGEAPRSGRTPSTPPTSAGTSGSATGTSG